ncbi:PREDICTED: molybdenum cofactor sulfurase isoform X4 [Nelumbo nucifera]|uniref:Molybdenum cofactor sulfurase n=1 Tax=Nelumbo nucifera TaxID=4432 RepID=A0A1U8B7M6_NELNU|nr:PREDICTED: molybdenum cofactor sulfurase isoform X4 [Nelumbo nucifera]
MDTQKEEFLKEFGQDYGYPNAPKNIDDIRASEFKRLGDVVYLDHAGATLYSELQMEAIIKDLTTNVYGNPHSQSESSLATSEVVRAARQLVLDYCNASPKDYKCVFTSGATAALKLVGEAFPWRRESSFMYTMENHNSVLGIKEYALNQGAMAFAIDIEELENYSGLPRRDASSIKVSRYSVQRRNEAPVQEAPEGNIYNLFAFPSECNFSGRKFSLDLVKIIKEDSERVLEGPPHNNRGCWMVLIDAAKGCTTQPPDLASFPADFVVISFYKIFGYPTGLGALIVHTEAAKLLKKTYFSGGTVAASIPDIDFIKRREGFEESFEDGTQSFLSIASIHHGFRIIHSLTASAIARHTSSLATFVRNMLLALRHENGASVCILYGMHGAKVPKHKFGPTVTFNLKHPDGSWVGYREVEKLASLSGIQLRKFISFVVKYFVSKPNATATQHLSLEESLSLSKTGVLNSLSTVGIYVRSITVYPIKSCAGFSVDSWPLSNSGLLHDREWILKSPNGEILTQKKVPEMCVISTFIDLNQGVLLVESPHCKEKLQINLESDSYGVKEEMVLHAQRYEVQGYDNEVDMWFTNAICRPCTLLRFSSSEDPCYMNKCNTGTCRDVESRLNFVNEAQFLLVSQESVSELNSRLMINMQKSSNGQPIHVDPMRFRPNLVISGAEPFAEDCWRELRIGNKCFTSLGGCNRCQMINIDHHTGKAQRSKEPLATLASFRRLKGKITFGILLRYEKSEMVGSIEDSTSLLQVGERVYPVSNQL